MNHVIIEKKCIIILCALYILSALFFVIAHYGLYDCYKRIIVCHYMRVRAHSYKRKYEANVIINEQPSSYTCVNRASRYLKENTTLYLKNYDIRPQEEKFDVFQARRQSRTKKNITIPKKSGRKAPVFPIKKNNNKHALFRWPLKKSEFWLSSFFGPRKKPDRSWGFHYGVDMAALKGTLVYAARGGAIVLAGYQRGYGNTVLISHANRYTTRYAHLDTIAVSQGAQVCAGKVIGTVGDTGYTITRGKDASHLHFEISIRGKQVNPLPLLPGL